MYLDPALAGFGMLVGLSLGMTGSGGSILAIPLLVYGAHVPISEALTISLIMVAMIAAFGAIKQTRQGKVDWRAAILFSLSGIIISPVVVSLTHEMNDGIRMGLFAILMILVALKMIIPTKARDTAIEKKPEDNPSLAAIAFAGGIAGCLAGFFGVGGGFIIVPLLVLVFFMPYNLAVGTSLASIALISSSAVIGHFLKGTTIDIHIIVPFVIGGMAGMVIGTYIISMIPETLAKKIFAFIIGGMAIFILIDNFILHQGGAL